MGYPVRLQAIKRGKSLQWLIYIPAAIASAMLFNKSETVEWIIEDRHTLTLKRIKPRGKKVSK